MSTRERKVTYKIEVEAGKGGTAVLDDVQRKATEAKNSVLALAKSLNEAAKAQVAVSTAAARSSVAGTGASRAGGGGGRAEINRELDGILRERAAHAERERKLATKTAEQERKLMSERIKANVEASRAAREAAKETTGDHYRGRAAEKAARDEQRARDERIKGFAEESAARRKAATETDNIARNTMKLVDSYKHLAHGGMLAARSFVMLTAANEGSLEAGLQKIAEFQGYVDAASSVKEMAIGAGGLLAAGATAFGMKGVTAGAIGSGALKLAAAYAPPVALAGVAAGGLWGFSKMFEESGYDHGVRRREVPVYTELQLREQAFARHQATMTGVEERLAEIDKMAALNEIRQSNLDRIGLGSGIEADIAANKKRIARHEAEFNRGQSIQSFDLQTMLSKVADNTTGRSMAYTAYAANQLEGSGISQRAALQLVEAERERFQLAERRGQIEMQTAQKSIEAARNTLEAEQEKLALMRRSHMTTKELYGDATPGERTGLEQAIEAAKEAERTGNKELVTKQHRDAFRNFNLSEVSQPFAIAEAERSPGFAKVDEFLRQRESLKQQIVNGVIEALKKSETEAQQKEAANSGWLDQLRRAFDARIKTAQEASARAMQAQAQEAAIQEQLKAFEDARL
jgi:hypothetical protein